MKQITINLPLELVREAERDAARQRTRRDGTQNSARAIIREWALAGRDFVKNPCSNGLDETLNNQAIN